MANHRAFYERLTADMARARRYGDTRSTSDPSELVRLADRALYSSKENGRDQVRLYTPASSDELAAT